MEDCIFCKIVGKSISSEIIYEDDKVIAILDAFPQAEGHTLIITKNHYKNLLEIEEDLDIIAYIKKVVFELQKKYEFTDFKIINNNGKKAGQEVEHVHFHIVPFYQN